MKKNSDKFGNFDIVIAETQTEGKARRENVWFSDKGMALFTFLVKKEGDFDDTEYLKLPLIAGLSVIKGLNRLEKLGYMFKWTNDIYLDGKKLCGILSERSGDNFYIGIGININNHLPENLKNIAVSLSEKTGKQYNITETALFIVEEFKTLYADFINGLWNEILS